MLMSLKGVTKRFGALQVLNDIDLDIMPGEILGIAGPNGAGKSTLLNACTGLLKPDQGHIRFADQHTEKLPPHRLCELGLARTFQIPTVFESLTVEQNIETGCLFGSKESRLGRQLKVDQVIQQLGLESRRHDPAGSVDLLSRKMVMLGAALATSPTLIFMDEPFGGLNTDEIEAYADLILTLRKEFGVTFVVVEHKIRTLSRIANRLMILNFGQVLCIDTPQAVLNNQQVIDIYLGATGHAQG